MNNTVPSSIPASLYLGSVTTFALVSTGHAPEALWVALLYVVVVYAERGLREVDLDNEAMPHRLRKRWPRPVWFVCFLVKGAVIFGAPAWAAWGVL